MAKRITKSSVNWVALAEKVPAAQKASFNALKSKSDGYLRRVLSQPESAPKIDFASYKKKISVPGLVDSLQKEYDAFKVPYPTENVSSQIDQLEQQHASGVKKFVEESKKKIADYETKISKWDSVLPYEEMTMEDFKDAHPDVALDPVNKPTFWPHTPEEQIGYKAPAPGSEEAAK